MKILNVTIKPNKILNDSILEIKGEFGTYLVTSQQLEDILIEEGQMCEDCGDSGEITTSERVWPGEPHMADIGSKPCENLKHRKV